MNQVNILNWWESHQFSPNSFRLVFRQTNKRWRREKVTTPGSQNLACLVRLYSGGQWTIAPRGGHSTFFQVGVCGPDFRSVGLANWHLPLKRGACERKISQFGGLWAENFQIWGLVSWKFPNFGACELKISKFWGLWDKIWVKIEAVEAKISKFSQKGVLWTDSFAWNGTLASGRRGVKRGSSGPHIPIPPF